LGIPLPLWPPLPSPIKTLLLAGSTGSRHLQALGARTLALAENTAGTAADRLALGREFLLAAWEEDPLDGEMAGQLLAWHARSPFLDAATVALLSAVSALWQRPGELRYYERLAAERDFARARDYLDQQAERDPLNLYWLQQIDSIATLLNDTAWARDRLLREPGLAEPGLRPLRAWFEANLLFAEGAYAAAAEAFSCAAGLYSDPDAGISSCRLLPLERRAECLLRLGDPDAARGLWRQVLLRRPWHVNLMLHAHDCLARPELVRPEFFWPADAALEPTLVLLYTWNKAPSLARTLETLAASHGVRRLLVVDNGSTDDTPALLQRWTERLGAQRLRVETLPVNIGAPAARNWLMRMPELRQAQYAAFVDDDVLLPPDWLGRLHAARHYAPDAAVWGCRVLDAAAPRLLQATDLHVLPAEARDGDRAADPSGYPDLAQVHARPFRISDLHNQVADYGQFDYLRPCASVTGCCHLFAVERLLESGPFHLGLGPTQYDDLEHDLRQAFQGRFACYQGFLGVRHLQRSGHAARRERAATGNWLANRYKLRHFYAADEIQRLIQLQTERLENDLSARLPLLHEMLDMDQEGRRSAR